MRRPTHLLLSLAALILVAAACGDDDSPATTAAATTTTAAPATTQPEAAGEAKFTITSVTIDASGQGVLIQNVGSATGNLSGFALCQAPSYHTFGDIELAPGEFIAVSLGGGFSPPSGAKEIITAGVGQISAEDGELGLYSSSDFGNSSAIVGYVEWGSSGHRRSSVAVGAGIWNEGDFVATSGAISTLSADAVPSDGAEDWTAG